MLKLIGHGIGMALRNSEMVGEALEHAAEACRHAGITRVVESGGQIARGTAASDKAISHSARRIQLPARRRHARG